VRMEQQEGTNLGLRVRVRVRELGFELGLSLLLLSVRGERGLLFC
jgi:hypothetical protein